MTTETTKTDKPSFYEDENIDEKIMAQEEEIEKQIASEQPLVGSKVELSTLLEEYSMDDVIYRNKVQNLCKRYKSIRRTRGDGNCFFRAFGFRYFESLIGKPEEIKALKELAQNFAKDLGSLGYNSFTIDDFKDVFMDEIEKITKNVDVKVAEDIFNTAGSSDYIVVFLRLIVSCYLQKNSDFFQSFVEGYATMKDFCSHEVEPMYRESDHIHIIALTNALKVPVGIIYLDRNELEDAPQVHSFPDDSKPSIFILYRPGHYDIIYCD